MILAALLLLATADDLALEVQNPGGFPSYLAVRDSAASGSALFYSFRRVDGVPVDDPRYVAAIQMSYRAEGSAVRLEVGVLFGRFDHNDTPRSLEGVRRETVGRYLIPLNTSARLDDLARYGIEPFEVRTVPPKPEVPNLPAIDNRTTALDVVGVGEDRTTYPVQLKNISQKNVVALELRSPRDRGSSGQRGAAKLPRVLIAPGEIHTVQCSIDRTGRSTSTGFVADPPARQLIVISAVVFDDGSWDGESETAAALLAWLHGFRLQLARIVTGLEALLRSGSNDPAEVRALAAGLPEEPSRSEIDAAAARFGALRPEALARELHQSLRLRRDQLLSLLKDYDRNLGVELRNWLEPRIEQYRDELRALAVMGQ